MNFLRPKEAKGDKLASDQQNSLLHLVSLVNFDDHIREGYSLLVALCENLQD